MVFREKQAIYLQIADYLCENILSKAWDAGGRIPSVRETAVSLEVNPNTVMRTFNYLQEKGIIYNKRGIGYFVSDDALEKTTELKKNEFLENELPRIYRAMDLLNLSIEDIKDGFEDYIKRKPKKKDE